jgi:protein translocase SecG subunit
VEWFKTLLIVLQVISALAVILLVLLQQGKGADMGAALPTSYLTQLLSSQQCFLLVLWELLGSGTKKK